MKEAGKIEVLDSLRAFAALSVCLFHFVCTTTGYIQNDWLLSVFSVGKSGVQAFFVISGFVIPWAMFTAGYQPRNFVKFFFKRLARLEPPYLFSLFLAILLLFLRARFYDNQNNVNITPTQVFLHLGYLIPWFDGYSWINQVYWTLCVEFQYYIFIALTFHWFNSPNAYIRVVLYLLYTGMAWIGNSAFFPYWGPIFLLGIVLFLFKSSKIGVKEYICVTAVLLALVFYLYGPIVLLYAAIPIVCILFYSNAKIPIADWLGKFSYSIYLIHPLVGASVINLLSHKYVLPYQKVVVVAVGVVVTLIASRLMYRLVEKPSKGLSARIRYNKNT